MKILPGSDTVRRGVACAGSPRRTSIATAPVIPRRTLSDEHRTCSTGRGEYSRLNEGERAVTFARVLATKEIFSCNCPNNLTLNFTKARESRQRIS